MCYARLVQVTFGHKNVGLGYLKLLPDCYEVSPGQVSTSQVVEIVAQRVAQLQRAR